LLIFDCKGTIYLTNYYLPSNDAFGPYFTLFVSALQAQSTRIIKTPETIQTEVEAEMVRARLDLAESQRRSGKIVIPIKKLKN
jgi:hypothetical protein